MADTENINKEKWEHETLRELVFTSLKEQRKARNWGIFFSFADVLLLVCAAFLGIGLAGY